MKAKYYLGILSIILLAGLRVNAQSGDNIDHRNDDAKIIVNNNYYYNYDYYYSSRISRFHKSYTVFNYYAPLYTDTYW